MNSYITINRIIITINRITYMVLYSICSYCGILWYTVVYWCTVDMKVHVRSEMLSLHTCYYVHMNTHTHTHTYTHTYTHIHTHTHAHTYTHTHTHTHTQHDTTTGCINQPGGNYIMYFQATDGSQANNNLFSSCSKTSINAVLTTKSSCFKGESHVM